MTNPCERLHKKNAAAFCGSPMLVSTRKFPNTVALPEPEIVAVAPVEFGAGVQ
ncbi:MAG: hypothetical protein R3F49_03130 [Planctomycetota bacterium]